LSSAKAAATLRLFIGSSLGYILPQVAGLTLIIIKKHRRKGRSSVLKNQEQTSVDGNIVSK
jgi:hypothetical protein